MSRENRTDQKHANFKLNPDKHALLEIAKSISRIPREMNDNQEIQNVDEPAKKKGTKAAIAAELSWLDDEKPAGREGSSCTIL
eukprot:CAMPEP_0184503122 /NCGR_PEP_ID=MMETSP0113_2-20130426/51701_1 /TAXON_ID=91329 /ORGANISM="Norrisiella sphaerica, Strain BC52" /LENGTH=82 /DNA_ID=CAMNT_0026892553 /DNA_START=405 /DNA_END=653 /DNA_ORIENTATION=-